MDRSGNATYLATSSTSSAGRRHNNMLRPTTRSCEIAIRPNAFLVWVRSNPLAKVPKSRVHTSDLLPATTRVVFAREVSGGPFSLSFRTSIQHMGMMSNIAAKMRERETFSLSLPSTKTASGKFVHSTTFNCEPPKNKQPQALSDDGRPEAPLTAAVRALHNSKPSATTSRPQEAAPPPQTAPPDAWTQAKHQLAHIELDFKSSQRRKHPSIAEIILSWCTCTDAESLDNMAWHGMHDLVPVDHRTGKEVE